MDFKLEQWINHAAGSNYLIDAAMVALAQWSEPFFIAVVLGWFAFGLLRGTAWDRKGAAAALLASGLALAANQLISQLWSRPRPFAAHPGAVHVLLAHPADASFPSDHVAAAVAIAVVLWCAHRRVGLAALVLTVAVGYARVFVGDHYPGDVVGGAVVGCAAGGVMVSPWVRKVIDRLDRAAAQRLAPRGRGRSRPVP
ncbi:MAG: phosphatase PAP2 family protein [Candidatus Dormibacteria bacterium]